MEYHYKDNILMYLQKFDHSVTKLVNIAMNAALFQVSAACHHRTSDTGHGTI